MESGNAERGQVVAAAADVYEEFFVPALFGQWVEPMLERSRVSTGDDVLDVGCGTGILARAAAATGGPTGRVAGLDCNQGMLAVARRAPEAVSWQHGSAERLPFEDDTMDRVLSQFALMFFDDREAALQEMARVLRPGGTVTVATWSAVEESPGYATMVELLGDVVGDFAAEALRAPVVLGSAEVLHDTVDAVFPGTAVEQVHGEARFESIDDWVRTDVRGWTLADSIDEQTYERLRTEAHRALAGYTDERGRVRFPAPALIATAVCG